MMDTPFHSVVTDLREAVGKSINVWYTNGTQEHIVLRSVAYDQIVGETVNGNTVHSLMQGISSWSVVR